MQFHTFLCLFVLKTNDEAAATSSVTQTSEEELQHSQWDEAQVSSTSFIVYFAPQYLYSAQYTYF